jgi:DNA polymerase-3 subunit delta'
MAFEKLKESQPQVMQLLENSIRKDRLSHAYLFEGEKGTKKFEFGLYFAMRLLCTEENKPCGKCHNCRRIQHFTHPNVYVIEPVKNMIKKQQIQDLQNEFNKTSVEPGPKVYIIRSIDQIHVSAANSLLKFLEEPHPNIYAVLTTENINKILPTIISRSQVIQFTSLSSKIVYEELVEEGYPEEMSHIISNLTSATGEAFDIASNEFFADIIVLVKDIFRLLVTREEPLVIYFNENSSIIYQDQELNDLFISSLMIYQKDIIDYKIGNMYHIAFEEEMDTIQAIARDKTKNRLIQELESMLVLKSKIHSYINFRLAYDNLLLNLERREPHGE